MSRNGSGGYSLPVNSWNPATNTVAATAADYQALINDIAAAIQQSVSADGQTVLTGSLNMGGFKLSNMAAGSATGESLRFEQLFSQGNTASTESAATVNIGAINSVAVEITGTTGITSLGTAYNGPRFTRFTGILTLTHAAPAMNLVGAANITTAAGDVAIWYPNASLNGWNMIGYQRAAGFPASAGANSDITSLTALVSINGVPVGLPILHVRDQKSTATAGGSSVAGTQTRTLNTVVTNTITGASLAANEVTLPAGTYRVFASAPAYQIGRHRIRLYNVTDAANSLLGTSEISNTSTAVQTRSIIEGGNLVLAATKNISLRHHTAAVLDTFGLGVDATDGLAEVYSELIFWRVA